MAVYTSGMQGTFAWSGVPVTEDLTRIDGIIAGCGEAALLVILNGLKGVPTSPAELGSIIQTAEQNHLVGRGGVSSPSGLESIASRYGVSLQSGNLTSLVNQYAGSKPIIVGISNAQAFGGRDTGVFGHYVTIVGRTANGALIVNDPNQSAKFGQFDVYTLQEFLNAHPFWAAVPSTWSPSSGSGSGTGTSTTPGGTSGSGPFGLQWPDWFNQIGQWVSGANSWFNAQRLLKIVLGVALLLIALYAIWNNTGVGQTVTGGVKQATELAAVAA